MSSKPWWTAKATRYILAARRSLGRERFGAESAASEMPLADRAYLRHLGLYAYRVKTLKRLARLEPAF